MTNINIKEYFDIFKEDIFKQFENLTTNVNSMKKDVEKKFDMLFEAHSNNTHKIIEIETNYEHLKQGVDAYQNETKDDIKQLRTDIINETDLKISNASEKQKNYFYSHIILYIITLASFGITLFNLVFK